MKMTVLSLITFASVLLLSVQLFGKNTDRVSFHVTSVQQSDAADYCTTGDCSATRFTVEGYTQEKDGGVQYVLDCVEVRSIICFRVHAHADYMVKIFDQSVTFGYALPSQRDPTPADYDIKSEKEIRKKR